MQKEIGWEEAVQKGQTGRKLCRRNRQRDICAKENRLEGSCADGSRVGGSYAEGGRLGESWAEGIYREKCVQKKTDWDEVVQTDAE